MGWRGVDPAVWARQVKQQLEDTFRTSVQELGIDLSTGQPEGDVPVQSGNLANSVQVAIGVMPTVAPSGTKFVTADLAAAQLLKIGDTAYVGYQANYARRQNYGFIGEDSLGRTYNQPGRGFVERAEARWPAIVERAAAKVRSQSSG